MVLQRRWYRLIDLTVLNTNSNHEGNAKLIQKNELMFRKLFVIVNVGSTTVKINEKQKRKSSNKSI